MELKQAKEKALEFGVKALLTRNNYKTDKSVKFGYLAAILHLAPYKISGRNVCSMAELASCIQGCLNTSGHGGMASTFTEVSGVSVPDNIVQTARINRTKFYHAERGAFMMLLAHEISVFIKYAEKLDLTPCIRLNGTSDIRWEVGHYVEYKGNLYHSIFDTFQSVQFYDYTKIPNRKHIPNNYHLTWSYSGASEKYAAMRPAEFSWAVVFNTAKNEDLPDSFLGRPVIDADQHDLRFLDSSQCVAGLRAKGRAKQDTSGFVVHV